MKKILIAGAVATVAATGSSVAADEIANAVVEDKDVKSVDCSCQSDALMVEQENINELNKTIQEQKLRVSEDKENVSIAENELATGLEQLENAAKKLEDITPEKIATATDKIKEIEIALVNDKSLESAKNQLKDAEQKVHEYEPILQAAQKDVESKLVEVRETEAKVQLAEATFDANSVITAQKEVSQLESTLKQTNQDLVELNKKLDALEKEKSLFYLNSKKKKEELEKAVKEAGPEYTTELVQYVVAENKVEDYDAYSEPKDPYFIKDGKKYYVSANENLEFDGEATEVIVLKNAEEYSDKEVDYEKVSQYISEYLKELRNINGIDIPVPPVTSEALKWAKARTDEMARNKKLSHDTILQLADFGIRDATENATTLISKKSKLSEKEIAYREILKYYNDYRNASSYGSEDSTKVNVYNYGHRIPLLGASGTGLAMQATEYYGILTFVSTNDKGVYSTLPSNSQKTWSAHFLASAKNEDEDPLRSEFYFNGKRTKFLPKTTFKYVWEETVHHKNEKYSSAVERLKQFELASASEETKLQEQSSILSKNKQELESSQKVIGDELSKTINRLNDLTKGNQEKLRNLEIVKKELESKQSELVPLQDILARKTAIYEELKAKVTQAQESVSRAEEDLKNLNTQLEQMKSELKSLQQADEDYTKAKSNLELVQKKLEDAQEKLKQDLLLLTALKSELQQKSLLLDECELKDDAKLDDLIYIPPTSNKPQNKSVNATNKVEQLVISKKRDNRVTGLKTVAPKETLPHTGEANSYLTVAGISMRATLSLVSTKKRKKSS